MTRSDRPTPDAILVSGLELQAHIGVPEEERLRPQRLTLNLRIVPKNGLGGLGDDLARTVDYFELSRQIQKLSLQRPRQLLETLAEEICGFLLENHPLTEAEVELRKYILNDAEYVAVRLNRQAHPKPEECPPKESFT